MISAISNQGKLHFLLCSESIDSEKMIAFMEALINIDNERKVYLILDNLRAHHSKLVTGWTQAHKEGLAERLAGMAGYEDIEITLVGPDEGDCVLLCRRHAREPSEGAGHHENVPD